MTDPGYPPPQHYGFQPQPHGSTPQQIVVPLSGAAKTAKLMGGALLCTGIGAVAVIGAIIGAVAGGIGVRIGAGVVGLIFLLLGIAMLGTLRKITRKRSLVFDATGIQCVDPQGQPWAIQWPELAQFSVTTAYHQGFGSVYQPKTWRIRLEWLPADPGFAQRHPELAPFQGRFGGQEHGYGFPLGPDYGLVRPIDAGMRTFAAHVYGGVVDQGQRVGFGYI